VSDGYLKNGFGNFADRTQANEKALEL